MKFCSFLGALFALSVFTGCAWSPFGGGTKRLTSQEGALEGKFECPGPFPSLIAIDSQKCRFTAIGLGSNRLSPAKDEGRVGSVRAQVFFDVSPTDPEADYVLFVYRDRWSLRRRNPSDPNNPIEVAAGIPDFTQSGDKAALHIEFARAYMPQALHGSWHEHVSERG